MIHIYGNGTQFDASEVSSHFVTRVNALLRSDSDLVVSYPDQSDIIAFNLRASQYYNATKLHPGGQSSDGADPTLLAVFLASYGSKYHNNIILMYPWDLSSRDILTLEHADIMDTDFYKILS